MLGTDKPKLDMKFECARPKRSLAEVGQMSAVKVTLLKLIRK